MRVECWKNYEGAYIARPYHMDHPEYPLGFGDTPREALDDLGDELARLGIVPDSFEMKTD